MTDIVTKTEATSESTQTLRLALLGAPNCGKTSMFNALTGGRAKVANYPGVTVEYRKGEFTLPDGQTIELLDLPGVYGDCGHSMDERVAIDAVRGSRYYKCRGTRLWPRASLGLSSGLGKGRSRRQCRTANGRSG